MKELFREYDSARVGCFQALLEAEGIQTHVRNRDLVTLMTDIPILEFYVALCVVNDDDYEEAREIIGEVIEHQDGGVEERLGTETRPHITQMAYLGIEACFAFVLLSMSVGMLSLWGKQWANSDLLLEFVPLFGRYGGTYHPNWGTAALWIALAGVGLWRIIRVMTRIWGKPRKTQKS